MTAARRLAAILAAEAVRRAASKTHWRLILPTPDPSSRSDWPLHVDTGQRIAAIFRTLDTVAPSRLTHHAIPQERFDPRVSRSKRAWTKSAKAFLKQKYVLYLFPSRELTPHRWRVRRQGEWSGRTRLRGFGPQPETRVGARSEFFIWIRCNALKSLDSAKGIQGNASNFPCFSLDSFAGSSPLGCVRVSIRPGSPP
jgi:hypothetical protein